MERSLRLRFAVLGFCGTALAVSLVTAGVLAASGEGFSRAAFLLCLGAGLAGALLVSGLYMLLTRTLYRRGVINRETGQTLAHELSLAREGELSVAWHDIELFVNGQRRVIPLRQVYDRLTSVLVESDRMSGELNRLADEILGQAVKLSRGSEDQSRSVTDSIESVDRIDASVRKVRSNAEGLQKMGENVSASTSQMLASIEQVNDNVQGLNAAMQDAASAIEQMAGNIKSVAESTDTLSMAAVQSRRSMEDIDRSNRVIKDRAESAAELAEAARDGSAYTKELLGKTVDEVRRVADTVEGTRKVMHQLGIQSRSIGEILTVISSVAADTHLLSLNASIMAAKAGEHGRGFAVVAQEIKTLAQRTAESAKEIESLIYETQESVDKAVRSIEDGAEQVARGMRLSEEADAALAEVLEKAEVAARNARDIAKDTMDQTEMSKEVYKAVEEVAKRTELIQVAMREQGDAGAFIRRVMIENQDLMEKVAMSMAEQSESSKRISAAMEKLTDSIQGIRLATEDQSKSSAGIVKAIDSIRKKAELVAISAQNVNNTSMSVLHQSLLLRNELKGLSLPDRRARYTLGLLFDNLREERWRREKEIFETRAAQLGAAAEFRAAEGDAGRQLEMARGLMDAGVDLIILVAVDAEAAGDIVALAKSRGAPIIAYDRLVKNSPLDLFVSFDATRTGTLQAETAVRAGQGARILVLAGSPADVNAHMLYKGQMEILKPAAEEGRIKLLDACWVPDWDPEQAYRLTAECIKKNGEPDAVVASNDGTAGGAVKAIKELLPGKKVAVTGMDAELAACRRIVEGSQTMTVYMPIKLQASRTIEAALLMLRGEDIPGITDRVDNGMIEVPAILLRPVKVDAENLEEVVMADGFHKREDIFGPAE